MQSIDGVLFGINKALLTTSDRKENQDYYHASGSYHNGKEENKITEFKSFDKLIFEITIDVDILSLYTEIS